MSGHRVRQDMASVDTLIMSNVDGERLDERRTWGAQYCMNSAGAETRKMVPPSCSGQKLMLVAGTLVGDINVVYTDTWDGSTGTDLVFEAAGEWAIIESFYIGGSHVWRVTSKHSGVSISS